jgi:hypothetical protein
LSALVVSRAFGYVKRHSPVGVPLVQSNTGEFTKEGSS